MVPQSAMGGFGFGSPGIKRCVRTPENRVARRCGAARAIARLCEHLELEEELAGQIRLAVTEACTNCVLHAYDAAGGAAALPPRSRSRRASDGAASATPAPDVASPLGAGAPGSGSGCG